VMEVVMMEAVVMEVMVMEVMVMMEMVMMIEVVMMTEVIIEISGVKEAPPGDRVGREEMKGWQLQQEPWNPWLDSAHGLL